MLSTQRIRRSVGAGVGFALLSLCAIFLQTPAHAGTGITTDGAAGLNVAYDQGLSTVWYIEDQDAGYFAILDGIKREDESMIQQGLSALQWGFQQEAADGSFPGSGDQFHSTSIFVAYAAQALHILANYKPVTHTYDTSAYQADIVKWTPLLKGTCYWMARPDIAANAAKSEFDYSHRRFIMASCYGQLGDLAGDPNLLALATSKAIEGINRALPAGWQAAMMPFDPTINDYPISPLVAPGATPPAGYMKLIDAQYVLPEQDGYDCSYQCVSMMNLVNAYPYIVDPTVQQQLATLLSNALAWDEQWIAPSGAVNVQGSSRIGVSDERNGIKKSPSTKEMMRAYYIGSVITKNPTFMVYANRVERPGSTLYNVTLGTDGAANRNIAYESGTSAAWYIGDQGWGEDAINAYLLYEDPTLLTQAFGVFDWGLKRQAKDGTFPGTQAPFISTATFVQNLSDSLLKLRSYNPSTYTNDPSSYAGEVASETAGVKLAAKWMLAYDAYGAGMYTMSTSTSSLWITAAAYLECANLTNTSAPRDFGRNYAIAAYKMQGPDGTNPEAGLASPTLQATGVIAAAAYYNNTTDQAARADIVKMINKALTWEFGQISPNGAFTSNGKRAPLYIGQAFAVGAAITGNPMFTVGANRIYVNYGKLYYPIPGSLE